MIYDHKQTYILLLDSYPLPFFRSCSLACLACKHFIFAASLEKNISISFSYMHFVVDVFSFAYVTV
jgi:hypothetical protein